MSLPLSLSLLLYSRMDETGEWALCVCVFVLCIDSFLDGGVVLLRLTEMILTALFVSNLNPET